MAVQKSYFPQISDEELVFGALLGDLGAFDELALRYRGAAIVVAQQELGSREVAEDAAQEALLLAFKALPQLENAARFGSWLCAITRHRARRLATRERRSEPTEPDELDRLILEQCDSLSGDPQTEYFRQIENETVREALATLPPDHQTVLRLFYYEEWPVARISNFLSIPSTTVKWRLHRGRELMRRRLTPAREENKNERVSGQQKQSGASPDPPDAASDLRNGPPCDHDRQHGRRGAHVSAAV